MKYVYRHDLDPIAFTIADQEIAWYWLVYLLGYFWCWGGLHGLQRRGWLHLSPEAIDRFAVLGWVGIILGGRLGYVLFYNPSFYRANPGQILAIWNGGMSFHGALLGIILCIIWFAKKQRNWTLGLNLADALSLLMPPMLAFGRIANFINGELVGRPSSWPFAVVFPQLDTIPRHPSQLYEAIGEGLILTIWLWSGAGKRLNRTGLTAIHFLLGYAGIRFLVEFVREPDPQINYWFGFLTQGQLLCLAMFALGLWGIKTLSKAKTKS